jgi:structural maintenance of chromosome 1
VYIGPLLDFTSIIGPNGAGKSNILDALMFCLCNERNKVTFYDLREFIQRDGS